MDSKIRVVQFGLGPIGSAMTRHVLERRGLELVGAVDVDPKKTGKDIGEVVDAGTRLGINVSAKLSDILAKQDADVVLHTTNSYVDLFKPQILEILSLRLPIVSTAEELSYPWYAHPAEGAEIDAAAKKAGRAVLATGVNPGFLMDTLPLNLTAICQRVDKIEVLRLQNASKRRGPFQAKIGSGMTVEAFNRKMKEGRMGHVGLIESVSMVCETLGKKLLRFETAVEPVVASSAVKTDFFSVKAGEVRGLRQTAFGYTDEGEFVKLVFHAALDEAEDKDVVKITGKPDLDLTLHGTNGDIATIAIAVNAIKRVLEAPPGLMTMRDLPLISCW